MLRAENVTVNYGTRRVVDQLSFHLQEGQWLMLVGPNGAGKSTLVEAIAGGVPAGGTILLEGKDIRYLRPSELARRIGVLSQRHQQGNAFRVEEVVRMGRYAYRSGFLKKGDPDGERKVEEALAATGMSELRHASMQNLSGGEVQRTFLAQVFAQDPSILILDEPANHLDLVYQKQVFSLIRDWLDQPGRAVISVVHDLSLAKRFGTHALLMHQGRCVAAGANSEVLIPAYLTQVYDMDVYQWMKDMLGQWQ